MQNSASYRASILIHTEAKIKKLLSCDTSFITAMRAIAVIKHYESIYTLLMNPTCGDTVSSRSCN